MTIQETTGSWTRKEKYVYILYISRRERAISLIYWYSHQDDERLSFGEIVVNVETSLLCFMGIISLQPKKVDPMHIA